MRRGLIIFLIVLLSGATAQAEDVYRAKGATAHFHSGPSGARVGTVYKNLPLKVKETRGDWVKVQVDAWFPKNTITKKKKKATKASKAAAAAAAAAAGSTALTLDSFNVQRRGDYSGEDKKAVLTLTIKNNSSKPIASWEGLLIVKDKAEDKLLFRYPVASDLKLIQAGGTNDFLFGWGADTDQYHALLSYQNPEQELLIKLVKVKIN